MLDASRLAGLMAEPDRRRVVAALILSSGNAHAISERTGLTTRRVMDANDDTAALRRYLVDEGLLDREAGEYWRSGGTVES